MDPKRFSSPSSREQFLLPLPLTAMSVVINSLGLDLFFLFFHKKVFSLIFVKQVFETPLSLGMSCATPEHRFITFTLLSRARWPPIFNFSIRPPFSEPSSLLISCSVYFGLIPLGLCLFSDPFHLLTSIFDLDTSCRLPFNPQLSLIFDRALSLVSVSFAWLPSPPRGRVDPLLQHLERLSPSLSKDYCHSRRGSVAIVLFFLFPASLSWFPGR